MATRVRPNRHRVPWGYLVVSLPMLLAGCSTLNSMLDSNEERLPGERISVLGNARSVTADNNVNTADIVLPRATSNVNWSQSGGNPSHVMHHVTLPGTPKPAWSKSLGRGAGRVTSPPIVLNNQAFAIGDSGLVSALDLSSGNLLWSTDLTPKSDDEGHFGGGLAAAAGRLYVTTGFGRVFALNAANGAVLWQKRAPAPVRAAPTFSNGTVYVSSTDNRVIAYSSDSGAVLWEFETGARTASLLGGASPTVDGKMVVVAFSNGELVGLDAETGLRQWGALLARTNTTDPVATLADIRGNPAIVDGTVYAVGNSGVMSGIGVKNGERIWSREIASIESPWVAGNFIFVVTRAGEVVCVSRKNGRIYWVRALPRYKDPEDKEGAIHYSGPVLASGRLYVVDNSGKATILSPRNGETMGQFSIGRGSVVPPVVASQTMLVLTTDGTLTAYR